MVPLAVVVRPPLCAVVSLSGPSAQGKTHALTPAKTENAFRKKSYLTSHMRRAPLLARRPPKACIPCSPEAPSSTRWCMWTDAEGLMTLLRALLLSVGTLAWFSPNPQGPLPPPVPCVKGPRQAFPVPAPVRRARFARH